MKTKKILNNIGFTLIELLGVIVILSLLVLVAMPNVTSLMSNAQESAFVTEAMEFATSASTAYSMSEISSKKDWYVKDSSNTSGYIYFCITIKDLINQGIVKKTNVDEYKGYIQLFIPKATLGDQKTYTNVNMSNQNYGLANQSLIRLANKSYEVSSNFTSEISCPAFNTADLTYAQASAKPST